MRSLVTTNQKAKKKFKVKRKRMTETKEKKTGPHIYKKKEERGPNKYMFFSGFFIRFRWVWVTRRRLYIS